MCVQHIVWSSVVYEMLLRFFQEFTMNSHADPPPLLRTLNVNICVYILVCAKHTLCLHLCQWINAALTRPMR